MTGPEAPRPQTSALITYLEGVDVSQYQGPSIDWPRVAASGISWAYCKASEGVTVTDSTFIGNVTRARAAGLRVGGYHYLSQATTPEAQAAHFLTRLSAAGWTPDDLPPAIDVESKTVGEQDRDVARAACAMLHLIRDALGVVPVLYTYAAFRVFASRPDLAAFPLWLAAYQAREPVAPPPWTGWQMWQWSGKALVPGVPTPCDRSRMVAPLP